MFIFSEDPPLKDKGHGLSVLLYNLFNENLIEIDKWFTFISGNQATQDDIVNGLNVPFKVIHLKGFNPSRLKLLYNQLLFLLFLPKIVISLNRNPKAPLFIPIGASAFILYKIRLFQILTKNPVWLYVVDDLEVISKTQSKKIDNFLCKLFLKKTLTKAQKIFAITEILGARLSKASKKGVTVIPPCFEKVDPIRKEPLKSSDSKTFTFVFTGGLSFLYNDTLKIFSDFLYQTEKETGVKFQLIIQTYSSKEDFIKAGFNASNTEYRTSESRSKLYDTYKEADAFIIPYSFSSTVSDVVSTSFPQKTAQIIQLGIPIVVFGPSYGSVTSYFKQHKLNYVLDQENYNALKETIDELLKTRLENSFLLAYQQSYETNFSPEACQKILIDSMS